MKKIHIDLLSEIDNISDESTRDLAFKLFDEIERNTNEDRVKNNLKREIEAISKKGIKWKFIA